MSVSYPTRGVCYAPNCTPPLWAACIVLHSRKQILENCACCQLCFQHDTNASCCQCCSLHATCPKSIYYETIKTATGVMRLLSLWIKLGYWSFCEIGSRVQCNKTFYVRNLRIFVTSLSVYPWQAFPTLV
jgi:hypothetical protein